MASRHSLGARQYYGNPAAYDSNYNSWWYSPTAYIVKWVITILILAAIFSYFGLGYMHAHRRMKKGLQPLRYHRFLVTRSQLEHYFPQRYPRYQQSRYAVPLQTYAPPPPGYHEHDYVPAYEPPQGSTKVNPDQTYVPPAGPPPGFNAASSSRVA